MCVCVGEGTDWPSCINILFEYSIATKCTLTASVPDRKQLVKTPSNLWWLVYSSVRYFFSEHYPRQYLWFQLWYCDFHYLLDLGHTSGITSSSYTRNLHLMAIGHLVHLFRFDSNTARDILPGPVMRPILHGTEWWDTVPDQSTRDCLVWQLKKNRAMNCAECDTVGIGRAYSWQSHHEHFRSR